MAQQMMKRSTSSCGVGRVAAAPSVPCIRPRSLQTVAATKEVFMPALSSTMTEGKIVSWLKSVGDKVKKGEPIVVVESDKADMDVESFSEGILGAIVVNEGERASVGSAIAFVAESEADLADAKSKAASLGGSAAPAAAPAAAAPAPPPPPPKAAAPAPVAAAAPVAAPPPPPAAAPVGRADGRIVATPYAKQLAKDLRVDISKVAGTGPNGRITASDVERTAGRAPTSAPASAAAPAAVPSIPASAPSASAAAPAASAASKGTTVSELRGTTKPFTSLQAAVSKNMVESLKVPEFRVSYSIQTDKLDALYQKLKPKGVTMSALLAKAVGVALVKHPLLWAACTPDGSGITFNDHINVAVAVAMPGGGLITPVLKDADKTDIYQMSRDWADLVKRARAKQLKPDEFTGLTFTISNLGMYGVDSFDAILPPGTAAILAVAGAKPTVVATEDGLIGVRKVMNVNLTADHRVVYGADAAEFLQTLKATIESPEHLTL